MFDFVIIEFKSIFVTGMVGNSSTIDEASVNDLYSRISISMLLTFCTQNLFCPRFWLTITKAKRFYFWKLSRQVFVLRIYGLWIFLPGTSRHSDPRENIVRHWILALNLICKTRRDSQSFPYKSNYIVIDSSSSLNIEYNIELAHSSI